LFQGALKLISLSVFATAAAATAGDEAVVVEASTVVPVGKVDNQYYQLILSSPC
jgi:hypothetical protein